MATFKDLQRMCETYDRCEDCPLYIFMIYGFVSCTAHKLPDDADEIVDKWVKEHPVKTYANDFFEKFPNAPKNMYGLPIGCIETIYGKRTCMDKESCSDCWNREMKEMRGDNDRA